MKPLICVTAGGLDRGGPELDFVNTAYLRMVTENRGIPVIAPCRMLSPDDLERIVDACDGLIVTGGPDIDPDIYGEEPFKGIGSFDPSRDAAEIALVKLAVAHRRPVLGICRGMQVVNVAFGGSLIQDIRSESDYAVDHYQRSARSICTHGVTFEDSCIRDLCKTDSVRVNSFHHQAVKKVGDGLVITGRAADGIAESLEHSLRCKAWDLIPDYYVVAVQWHLEEVWDQQHMRPIISEFIQTCKGD